MRYHQTSSISLPYNWLRVLDTAEYSQVDQRVCQHLHAIMPLLDMFKQPLQLALKEPF